MKRQGEMVRGDLGRRIWRLAGKRVLFRHRELHPRAVNLACGSVDEASDARISCGLEQIQRALDVRLDVRFR